MARSNYVLVVMGIALLTSTVARAQEQAPEPSPGTGATSPQAECPPDEPDEDVPPSYGQAGVWELGGSIGFWWAEDDMSFDAAPSAGVFVIDYVELSLIVRVEYDRDRQEDGTWTSETTGVVLFEPSGHLPIIEDDLFLFGGVGFGAGYDGGPEFEIVPRAGVNIARGPGRMLTPSIRVPVKFVWEEDANGEDQFDSDVELGIEIGYSTLY